MPAKAGTMMPTSANSKTADLELITIYQISKVLNSSLDFRKCVRQVLNLLLSHLQMQHAQVGLVQEGGELHIIGAAGNPADTVLLNASEGVVAKVMKNGVPVVIPDITQDPNFLNCTWRDMSQSKGVSYIAVPLRDDREVIGLLSVDRHPGGERSINFDRDVRLLTLVGNLLAQTWKLHQAVAEERQLQMEEQYRLQKQLQGKYDIENVVGRSKRMKEVFADVHLAAPSQATVLLRGESGTGKEAIANAIHYLSPRAKGPFIKVNCASLSETLLESELFGHEKGAFTGAANERKGRFELADGGTLFLDEIGDVSPAFQSKLLRVLQEHEFERVGGNKTLKANFRLVAATNRNLEEMVQKGEFRGDLYFRLNVVTIMMPSLRERKDDIPLLVDFFLGRFNRENSRNVTITPGALEIFQQCNWPGNVRELENCVERAATMMRGTLIREADLRCQKGQCFSSVLVESARSHTCYPIIGVPMKRPSETVPQQDHYVESSEPTANKAESFVTAGSERDQLVSAMERCGWVQAKAARLLNMTPRQIGYALKKYNIELKQL